MLTTQRGRQAEDAAATFLRGKGFVICMQNWRTRWCEIDIVAQKAGCIYFVEVKYRGSDTWGAGLEYITPRKLRQMHFAAEFWMGTHSQFYDYRLAAIELTDDPPQVLTWCDDL